MSVTINGTSGLTFNDASTQNTAAKVGMVNRIINGDCRIDQRNAGASVTQLASVVYGVDRWYTFGTVTSKFTLQQSTDAPAGFKNSIKATSSSAYTVGTSEQFIISQAVEGFNYADMMYGTSGAATATLSFWVKSSLTGTFAGGFGNADNNRSYSFSYTINSANTWEYKTITFTGDLTGTWKTANEQGVVVNFSMGTGSTFQSTVNTWAAGNFKNVSGAVNLVGTDGATFYITGVQLEKGSTATSFDYRPYGTELALCQRYCYAILSSESNNLQYNRFGIGEVESSIATSMITNLPVKMRAVPSLTTQSTAANYAVFSAGTVTACSAVPSINPPSNPMVLQTIFTTASGPVAGRAAQLVSNNNNTSFLIYSAEL